MIVIAAAVVALLPLAAMVGVACWLARRETVAAVTDRLLVGELPTPGTRQGGDGR